MRAWKLGRQERWQPPMAVHCPSSCAVACPVHTQLNRACPASCTLSLCSDDGSGKYYPEHECALKRQPPIPAGGQPSVYAQGKLVHWTSGYLPA